MLKTHTFISSFNKKRSLYVYLQANTLRKKNVFTGQYSM
jgi:hypothetical protein